MRNQNKVVFIWLTHIPLVALCLFALLGCSSDEVNEMQDLKLFVRDAGIEMRGKVSPPPELNLIPAIAFKANASVHQPFDPARLNVTKNR
jgi:hypothetical protein